MRTLVGLSMATGIPLSELEVMHPRSIATVVELLEEQRRPDVYSPERIAARAEARAGGGQH